MTDATKTAARWLRKNFPVDKAIRVYTRTLPDVNSLVVISDTHIGCQMGLMHPDGAMLDEGGLVLPNKLQKVVWIGGKSFGTFGCLRYAEENLLPFA